jgi:hypothetical protein
MINFPKYLTISKGTKIPCQLIEHPRIRKFMDDNKDKFKYDPINQYHEYIGFDWVMPDYDAIKSK